MLGRFGCSSPSEVVALRTTLNFMYFTIKDPPSTTQIPSINLDSIWGILLMEEILHHLIYGKYPIIYRGFSTIAGGFLAGFLNHTSPGSTV